MKFIHYTTDGRERACLSLEHVHSQQLRQTLIDGGVALRPHSKRQVRHPSRPARMSIRTAPYGYCLVNGKREVDPKEASVVRLMMKWWEQGMSYCAIARRLNEQNIKPRKAAQWSQPTVGFIIQREVESRSVKKKNGN